MATQKLKCALGLARAIKSLDTNAFSGDHILMRRKRRKNDLYYMLPGSHRSARKRARQVLAFGILVSALVCGLMIWVFSYFNNR